MKKSILIIGAGPGLSQGIAEKFGSAGFSVSLISRNVTNLENLKKDISQSGTEVNYAVADAGNAEELKQAISTLTESTGGFDVVLYNVVVVTQKDILEENAVDLAREFTLNVAHALVSLQATYSSLKERKGVFLLTGGGFAYHPNAQYGSLSLGKASLRNLAYQLNERLKTEGIFAGLVSVAGQISKESTTHSPAILAEDFFKLYQERNVAEIQH